MCYGEIGGEVYRIGGVDFGHLGVLGLGLELGAGLGLGLGLEAGLGLG